MGITTFFDMPNTGKYLIIVEFKCKNEQGKNT